MMSRPGKENLKSSPNKSDQIRENAGGLSSAALMLGGMIIGGFATSFALEHAEWLSRSNPFNWLVSFMAASASGASISYWFSPKERQLTGYYLSNTKRENLLSHLIAPTVLSGALALPLYTTLDMSLHNVAASAALTGLMTAVNFSGLTIGTIGGSGRKNLTRN